MPQVETGSLKSSGRVCKKSEQIVSRFGMKPKKISGDHYKFVTSVRNYKFDHERFGG